MTDLARAIEALEMTLAQNPRSSAGFQELAGLKLAGGDIEGAIASYSRCITFAPQNAAARNNLGAAYGSTSSRSSRRVRCQRITGLETQSPSRRHILAVRDHDRLRTPRSVPTRTGTRSW